MFRTEQARLLADTSQVNTAVWTGIIRCRQTGLDPNAYRGYVACAVTLLAREAPGNARTLRAAYANTLARWTRTGLHRWRGERELIRHLIRIEEHLRHRIARVQNMRGNAEADLAAASDVAATADDPKVIEHARRIMADCSGALQILEQAEALFAHLLARIVAIPEEMGETYAAVYKTISRGHVLPHEGRWFAGQGTTASQMPT